MSLNKFMHPRNRYKCKRPDFDALAKKYPEFQQHIIENEKGKPVLDFKNPDAVRVLTTCLLQEDYGLKIDLPPDRLVPTIPLRLNYIHWMEDITKDWDKKELLAIDIGTGVCCVYPILAISGNPWRFLATEADDMNFSYAVKNLEANKLTDRITVVKVSEDTILEGVIGNTEETYDFCMCNPPFFADHFEAQGLVSRTPSRPEAKTMSTASPQEGIVQGGEIAFVRKMIDESNFLQDRVRVYSTMLGKKASLAPLKEILRRNKIENFASTEFCQGKTMRWGLAWTFDKTVKFPRSEFSQSKKEGKKSLVHVIPTEMGERRERVSDLVSFFKQVFSEFKIHCREGKQSGYFSLLTITAAENTWVHSRRKRRQMMRETPAAPETAATDSGGTPSHTASKTAATHSNTAEEGMTAEVSAAQAVEVSVASEKSDRLCENDVQGKDTQNTVTRTEVTATVSEVGENMKKSKRKADNERSEPSEELAAKRAKRSTKNQQDLSNGAKTTEEATPTGEDEKSCAVMQASSSEAEGHSPEKEEACEAKGKDRPPAQFVLKCHMCVRVQDADLAVELTWLGGENIQLMHQLMQIFKNKLAARKPA